MIPLSLLKESLWFCLPALKDWLREHYAKDYEQIVQGAAPGTSNLGVDAFSCNAHHVDLIVDAKGEAVLCNKVGLGNINRLLLVDLWNCAAAVQFRREIDADRGPCTSCDYRQSGAETPPDYVVRVPLRGPSQRQSVHPCSPGASACPKEGRS